MVRWDIGGRLKRTHVVKFFRDEWKNVLPIFISLVALLFALRADQSSKRSNEIAEEANLLAREANDIAVVANQLVIDSAQTNIQIFHEEFTAYDYIASCQYDYHYNVQHDVIFYNITITNSGGKSVSLLEVEFEWNYGNWHSFTFLMEPTPYGEFQPEEKEVIELPLVLGPGEAKTVSLRIVGWTDHDSEQEASESLGVLGFGTNDASSVQGTWTLKFNDEIEKVLTSPVNSHYSSSLGKPEINCGELVYLLSEK